MLRVGLYALHYALRVKFLDNIAKTMNNWRICAWWVSFGLMEYICKRMVPAADFEPHDEGRGICHFCKFYYQYPRIYEYVACR